MSDTKANLLTVGNANCVESSKKRPNRQLYFVAAVMQMKGEDVSFLFHFAITKGENK